MTQQAVTATKESPENPYASYQNAEEPSKPLRDETVRKSQNQKARIAWWLGTLSPAVFTAAMFLLESFLPHWATGPVLFTVMSCWVIGLIVASIASFYLEGTIVDKVAYCVTALMLMLFSLVGVFVLLVSIFGAVRE